MAYRHDIFLSYVQEYPFGEWVNDVFYPLFKPHLESALGRKIDIFIDRVGISTGDAWPERLWKALAESKYLVAVLSPQYFLSNWCKYEFGTIHYRATQLGCVTQDKPNGLILPVNIRDGKHFPQVVRRLHYFDCREYLLEKESFRKTIEYTTYQRKIIDWSDKIAVIIEKAPRWSKQWASDEWHRAAIEHTDTIFPTGQDFRGGPPRLE